MDLFGTAKCKEQKCSKQSRHKEQNLYSHDRTRDKESSYGSSKIKNTRYNKCRHAVPAMSN